MQLIFIDRADQRVLGEGGTDMTCTPGTFGDDGYAHYLCCGAGFRVISTCQNLQKYILFKCM